MSLEDAYYVSQIIAAVAILATLIFAVLELRRNTHEIRTATAVSARLSIAQQNETIANGTPMALAVRVFDPNSHLKDLNDEQTLQVLFILSAFHHRNEAIWYQWREGGLPLEIWQSVIAWFRNGFAQFPMHREAWERVKHTSMLSPSFVRAIDAAVRMGPTATPIPLSNDAVS